MAKVDFRADIDLNDNQLLNVKLQHLSGDPNAIEGQVFYHSGSNVIKFHNGTEWLALSSGTGDITNVIAGVGLSGGATSGEATVTVDFSEFSDVTPANGDKLATLDSDGSTEQLTTVASLATLFAGSGLTASNSVIAVDTLNQNTSGTADKATHVLVSDNESANEANEITFVENAAAGGAQRGLESSAKATFNPSTGKITATGFVGALTGNASGSAGTVTSIGNLTGEVTSTNRAAVIANNVVDEANLKVSNGPSNGYFLSAQSGNTGGLTWAAIPTLNQNTTGSAATLTTARAINGVDFNGSAAITVTAAAGTLSGNTLKSTVVASSLTSVGTLATGVWNASVIPSAKLDADTAHLTTAQTFTGSKTMGTNTKLNFRDANAYINSPTANDIEVVGTTITLDAGSDIQLEGNTTVTGNISVSGNLNIDGTTTTIDSTTVAIADSMLKLAKDQANNADALDFGFYGQYGVGGTHKYAGVFRDGSVTGDPFTFFDSLQAEPGTTVNTSGTGYDLADISAGKITSADGFVGNVTGNASGSAGTVTSIGNLTGHITSTNRGTVLGSFTVAQLSAALSNASISGNNTGDQTTVSGSSGSCTGNAATATALANSRTFKTNLASSETGAYDGTGNVTPGVSGTLPVGNGGTGATSLTNGGILLGSGTGAVTAMAVLANGAMIVGDGTTDPVAESGSTLRTSIGVGPTAGNTSLVTLGTVTTGVWAGTEIGTSKTAAKVTSIVAGAGIDVNNSGVGAVTVTAETASATNPGVVELATTAEALAGTDTTRAVTSAGLAARSYRAAIGNGSATAFNVDHGLGTRDVTVQMYDASSYETVYAQIVRSTTARVVVTFNVAPANNDIIILITKID